ncbi:EboA domain-containing protein [Streptomyces sp. NPDC017202]|uniref:EboA domain-containing protein n=1 Tax=Streptomyces sp. NPDC017202 TaxID=3364981 RepID=UPI0037BCCB55
MDARADDRLAAAERRVRERPRAIHEEFPLAGRPPVRHGTGPDALVLGTDDDRARARLLSVLAEVLSPQELRSETERLYRHGDDAERRGVLRALPVLPASVRGLGLTLVADGLRSNDPRLVAAAMGPFAAAHLDQRAWRQGVLKCLFVGVPLAAVAGLERRADAELLRMARDLAEERRAAGRETGPDLRALLDVAVPPAPVPSRGEDDPR